MADRTTTDFVGGMFTGRMKSEAAIERGAELMVFDWDACARYIREHRPSTVEAGLSGDWGNTGGPIYRDGKPVPEDDTYTYLASLWAEPKMIVDDREDVTCFRPQSEVPDWGSGTYWPESALAILNAA